LETVIDDRSHWVFNEARRGPIPVRELHAGANPPSPNNVPAAADRTPGSVAIRESEKYGRFPVTGG
jgi:hypothetical protein